MDRTKVKLLYANRSEDDILLRRELQDLAKQHPDRFELRFLVEARGGDAGGGGDSGAPGWWQRLWQKQQPSASEAKSFSAHADGVGIGRVSEAAVRGYLPAPGENGAVVLVCGPEGMLQHLCGDPDRTKRPRGVLGGVLGLLGYDGRQVVEFSDRNGG